MHDLVSKTRFAQIVINTWELAQEPGASRDRDEIRGLLYALGVLLGFSHQEVTEILESM